MKLLSERVCVKEAIERWLSGAEKNPYAKNNPHITPRIKKLDPETATAKDVAAIIGNSSWAGPYSCDECNAQTFDLVQLGQEPDYESATANICVCCLNKALGLIKPSTTN